MRKFLYAMLAAAAVSLPGWAAAQATFVKYGQPVIAITHAKLVDGTGAKARNDITVVIRDGRIAAVGPAASTPAPAGAVVIDERGKTVLPGFVMMHEHMFYPTGDLQFGEMLYSFPPLYLSGGATTIRTAGSLSPYADLNLRDAIAAGKAVGPDIEASGPYLDGAGLPVYKIHGVANADEAERLVGYWADEGATSIKAYMLITRAELKRAIEVAHRRGMKVTGHLCSVTYREAAGLGIDNLEHGFGVMTDFLEDKKPDACPLETANSGLDALDPESPAVKDLIRLLVERKVALTSTLAVFEGITPGRPKIGERAMSVLQADIRKQYEDNWTAVQGMGGAGAANFKKLMRLERMFVDAGGHLMSGTDPTGIGGVVPGFANKRQVQLLVEAGFPFEEAVRISTLNGARFLGRDHQVGTVEPGKRADLIVVDGDPAADASVLDAMPLVFKNGVGYDTAAIVEAMKGVVGLR